MKKLDLCLEAEKKSDELNEKFFGFKTSLIFMIVKITIIIVRVINSYKEVKKEGKYYEALSNKINEIIKEDNLKVKINKVSGSGIRAYTTFFNEIFYNSGIKNILNDDEFIAVMLHEACHCFNKDLTSFVSLLIKTSIVYDLLFGVLFELLPFKKLLFIVKWILMLKSIKRNTPDAKASEYAADSYATKWGYGTHLISAIVKIKKFLAKDMKDKFDARSLEDIENELNNMDEAKHPSFLNRIKAVYEQLSKMEKMPSNPIMKKE